MKRLKPTRPTPVEPKRSLEPIGTYDPYRPRVFGTADEIVNRRLSRDLIDTVMTNEVFQAEKRREIAGRTRALAAADMLDIENSLKAEREARQRRVKRP